MLSARVEPQSVTIIEAFEAAVSRTPDRAALRYKADGEWQTFTWTEYRDLVRRAAKAMLELGVQSSACVVILGGNRWPWLVTHLGAIFAGALPAGVYPTSAPEQVQLITEHCRAELVVVENEEQLAKFRGGKPLPHVRAYVLMEGTSDEPDVYSFESFLSLGEASSDDELEARIAAQRPDHVCSVIYTSGTTGEPKGVMLSHDNITWTSNTVAARLGVIDDEHIICYLPLCHIAEQLVSLYVTLTESATVWLIGRIDELGEALPEIRPTVFLAVPRVWEKMQARIQAAGAQASPMQRLVARWARSVALGAAYADEKGAARPLMFPVAERLLFDKVRQRLGLDRCRFAVSGAAPLGRDTLEFFLSLGIPIHQVYGMSETTGVIAGAFPGENRIGKVGRSIPGSEVRIADDGELVVRGRQVFVGYLDNEEATVVARGNDGWLHTGDLASIDDDGYVEVTGRKKELLVTAGGENVAPSPIEGRLRGLPGVSNAVVIGDGRKHLSALLTLDADHLEQVIAASGTSAKTLEEMSDDQTVRQWLFDGVQQINQGLARVQQIKKIQVLPRELSQEHGELTATMKLRRKQVNANFAELIERLYQ